MTPAGLLGTLSDWYERNQDKLVGSGIRGAATRGLLGLEPPKDATKAEMEAYRNFANASMALAAGPVAAVKAAKGAKAANSASKFLDVHDPKTYQAVKKELEAAGNRIYPQSVELEIARRNGVKIGLPETNTGIDRAKATGYLDDTYHGTFGRFENFDLSKANPRSQYMPGIFTADDPKLAENFGDYIMPLLQRKGTTVIDKRNARNAGLPLPEVDTIHDKAAGIRVTNKPENIRSRFAAFDPARIDEKDLLASLAAMGITLPLTMGLLSDQTD